jgi:acetyl-CoA acetyltransferase
VTTADRARDAKKKPAYIMAAAQGSNYRHNATVENSADYASSNFKTLAPRLFETAGITAKDVDCAQIYEHFSGAVMISLVEHGFCKPEEVMEFVTFENITAPKGKLPVNTSGGNIAECYMHGLELVNEAVRQVRSDSTCQVPNAKISLVASGPMVSPLSDLIVHSL